MKCVNSVGSGRRRGGRVSRVCAVGSVMSVGISGMVWCDSRCW